MSTDFKSLEMVFSVNAIYDDVYYIVKFQEKNLFKKVVEINGHSDTFTLPLEIVEYEIKELIDDLLKDKMKSMISLTLSFSDGDTFHYDTRNMACEYPNVYKAVKTTNAHFSCCLNREDTEKEIKKLIKEWLNG